MNRRRTILLIAGIEAMLFGIIIALFVAGAIKMVTFAALTAVAGVAASTAIIALRKFYE